MRCLVLSGGGCKGSYEAGAVRYLMGEREIRYSMVAGVSAGALNAAFLCQYEVGDEKAAASGLSKLWDEINTSKVWKRWFPWGKLHGFWGESALNSRPLHQLVRKRLDREALASSGRKLRVGSVNLRGQYRVFSEDEDEIVDAVLASSAVPALFLPIRLAGETWVDGAIRDDTPIKAAIDAGADEIDVVVTSPKGAAFPPIDDPNAIDVLLRAIDILADEVMEGDLKVADLYNRLVRAGGAPGKRDVTVRVIRPTDVLVDDLLDFDHKVIADLHLRGYNDAKAQMPA